MGRGSIVFNTSKSGRVTFVKTGPYEPAVNTLTRFMDTLTPR